MSASQKYLSRLNRVKLASILLTCTWDDLGATKGWASAAMRRDNGNVSLVYVLYTYILCDGEGKEVKEFVRG